MSERKHYVATYAMQQDGAQLYSILADIQQGTRGFTRTGSVIQIHSLTFRAFMANTADYAAIRFVVLIDVEAQYPDLDTILQVAPDSDPYHYCPSIWPYNWNKNQGLIYKDDFVICMNVNLVQGESVELQPVVNQNRVFHVEKKYTFSNLVTRYSNNPVYEGNDVVRNELEILYIHYKIDEFGFVGTVTVDVEFSDVL